MAIIERSGSLLMATAILAMLELRLQEGSYHIECYQNCREQGYTVQRMDTKERVSVTFAEHRNGDYPVIYFDGVAPQGITEKSWKARRSCDSIDEAVQVCLDHLERDWVTIYDWRTSKCLASKETDGDGQ